jgi:hypothetical protein
MPGLNTNSEWECRLIERETSLPHGSKAVLTYSKRWRQV